MEKSEIRKCWDLDFKKITSKGIYTNDNQVQELSKIILNKLYAIACYNPLNLYCILEVYGANFFKGEYYYEAIDIYNKYLLSSKLFRAYDCALGIPTEEFQHIFGYVLRYRACTLHLLIMLLKKNEEKDLDKLQTIDKILINFFDAFWNLTRDSELEVYKLEELIFTILFEQMKLAKLIKDSDLEYLIRNTINFDEAMKYENYEQIENKRVENNIKEQEQKDIFKIPPELINDDVKEKGGCNDGTIKK